MPIWMATEDFVVRYPYPESRATFLTRLLFVRVLYDDLQSVDKSMLASFNASTLGKTTAALIKSDSRSFEKEMPIEPELMRIVNKISTTSISTIKESSSLMCLWMNCE